MLKKFVCFLAFSVKYKLDGKSLSLENLPNFGDHNS